MTDLPNMDHASAAPHAISVLGIDLGHGETMVALWVNGHVRILRQQHGDDKLLTACAMVLPEKGKPVVLIGNVLLYWDEFRMCTDGQITEKMIRLLAYYVDVLQQERPGEKKLYIPCDPKILSEEARTVLKPVMDDGWELEQATFTPVYQHFKAAPGQWTYVRDVVAGEELNARRLMCIFLAALKRDLARNYREEEAVQAALEGQLAIGVPASPAYAAADMRKQYAQMLAEAWQTDINRINVHVEPYAALLRGGFDTLSANQLVFDSGSVTLDGCCIAIKQTAAGEQIVSRYTASTDKCGGHLVEKELLKRILRQEKLTAMQLRWGEQQALLLRLRFIKEYFCLVETDSLYREIDIHLSDGRVVEASFNMARLMHEITGEGSAWFKAAAEFFRDAKTALMLNGIRCETVFITGGNANVPGLLAAARRGLAANKGEPEPEIIIAEDKSAAVARGLCNVLPEWAVAEQVEQALRSLMDSKPLEQLARKLRDDVTDGYKKYLPQLIANAAQTLAGAQKPCKRSDLMEMTAQLALAHKDLRDSIAKALATLVTDSADVIQSILGSMHMTPLGCVGLSSAQARRQVDACLTGMEQELLKLHRLVAEVVVPGIDFRGFGVNAARRLFALPLAMVDVMVQSIEKDPSGFGLLEDRPECDYPLTANDLRRLARRAFKEETIDSIVPALYQAPLTNVFARQVYRMVVTWYARRAMGLDADEERM